MSSNVINEHIYIWLWKITFWTWLIKILKVFTHSHHSIYLWNWYNICCPLRVVCNPNGAHIQLLLYFFLYFQGPFYPAEFLFYQFGIRINRNLILRDISFYAQHIFVHAKTSMNSMDEIKLSCSFGIRDFYILSSRGSLGVPTLINIMSSVMEFWLSRASIALINSFGIYLHFQRC